VFKGQDAVNAGLADEVGTLESVLGQSATARIGPTKGVAMSQQSTPVPAARITQSDLAKAEADAGAAATARVKAILHANEAKGREALARHLAFKTALPASDAIAALGAAAPAAGEADSTDHGAKLRAAITKQLARLGKEPKASRH